MNCETGNQTSAIYLENNNLFGLRNSVKRDRYWSGINRGHATYHNIGDSISDYLDLLDSQGISRRYYNQAEWAALMKNIGYYSATYNEYLNCLQ